MGIIQVAQQNGVWRGYARHILTLEPILSRMSERGFPVSPEAFAEAEALILNDMDRAHAAMQELVPLSCKTIKLLKREPKDKAPNGAGACIQLEDGAWGRVKEWTPSNKGLIAYMRHRKHPVPKNFKTDKDTTNKLEIARLFRATKDPLYEQVLYYRKAQTVLKNHIKNWAPGPDGLVHSTFYYDPATGQLSSRRPNVQNAPKRDDPEFGGYAKVFRSMIKARSGHMLLEFDYKSFHAQTLAFEAQDPAYLRLAKLDIHSYLAAFLIREPRASQALGWGDDELRDYLAWIKKNHKYVRDGKAKPAILGYGFGMGAGRLYDQNKESFASRSEAKRVLDMLDAAFPVTKRFRDNIRQKAHDQGYLISRHGYVRYFREVFNIKWVHGQMVMRPGDDSEAAIAFLPANDAFGEIKDCILRLEALGALERYRFVNTVHDSLVFECPTNLVDECIPIVQNSMQRPSEILIDPIVAPHGLSVEVDVSAGLDWAHLKGI
jgi:DNA polymerase I-like protein with 3'-5' exonuclease and polymerase domains